MEKLVRNAIIPNYLFLGVVEHITHDVTAFGISITNLNAESIDKGDDFVGKVSVLANAVTDVWHVASHFQVLGLKDGKDLEEASNSCCSELVIVHAVHRAVGLNISTTSVQSDTLSDQDKGLFDLTTGFVPGCYNPALEIGTC